MLDALELVTTIVVVANQELSTVRGASRMAAALRQRYGKDRVTVVVSRFDQVAEIGRKEIERVMGGPIAQMFPSDYRLALGALNVGRPSGARQPQQAGRVVHDLRSRAGERFARRTDQSGTARRSVQPVHQSNVVGVRGDTTDELHPCCSTHGGGADARNRDYQELKARIHQQLLNRLNLERLNRVAREEAEPQIRDLIVDMIGNETRTTPLSLVERETLVVDVLNELFGLGPLEALLRDPDISDILVNRFDQVYIERNGRLETTDILFKDNRHLLQIIERIVGSVGRRIDESSPMVDARLKDGSRVNAIIPPLALEGPVLSIRRFLTTRLGAQDLVERETLSEPMLDFLQRRGGQPPQHHRVGRHRRRQDDAAERALRLHLGCWSGSSPSKTRPNCCCGSATWCGSRRGRPTSKGKAPSASAISW